MGCCAPSAQSWRNQIADWSEVRLSEELHRAWHMRPNEGPPYAWRHHDWTNFRAATLREARKRGMDISITGLGT